MTFQKRINALLLEYVDSSCVTQRTKLRGEMKAIKLEQMSNQMETVNSEGF